MTVSEIKGLTKYLTEEEIEKIKQEIKDKETILKSGNLTEEEMVNVLNTLFAVLVIEKTLESEIEEVEDIRAELEAELLECYNIYDSYMLRYKKEEKKKKKRWLLALFGLSENISKKKNDINDTQKTISKLKNELNELKKHSCDENLKEVVSRNNSSAYEKFCDTIERCNHPNKTKSANVADIMKERKNIEKNNVSKNHRHTHHKGKNGHNLNNSSHEKEDMVGEYISFGKRQLK